MMKKILSYFLLIYSFTTAAYASEEHSFEIVWNANEELFHKIIGTPFIQEMVSGELPLEKFHYYLEQDLYYLLHDIHAFKMLSKYSSSSIEKNYLDGVVNSIEYEIGNIFSKAVVHAKSMDIFPECESYVAHLLDAVSIDNYYYATGCLMPCVFSYFFIAEKFLPHVAENNPYYSWFRDNKDYGIDEALEFTSSLLRMATDKEYQDFLRGFEKSMAMEHLFWCGLYQCE